MIDESVRVHADVIRTDPNAEALVSKLLSLLQIAARRRSTASSSLPFGCMYRTASIPPSYLLAAIHCSTRSAAIDATPCHFFWKLSKRCRYFKLFMSMLSSGAKHYFFTRAAFVMDPCLQKGDAPGCRTAEVYECEDAWTERELSPRTSSLSMSCRS